MLVPYTNAERNNGKNKYTIITYTTTVPYRVLFTTVTSSNNSRKGSPGLRRITEVPGIVAWAYITHSIPEQVNKNVVPVPRLLLWLRRTELTEVPGAAVNVVHNLHIFRVRG